MKRLLVFLFIFLTVNSYGKSVERVNGLPVVIEAQKLTYNNKEKVAVYVGNVIAQRGKTILTGDKLIVYFTPDGKNIRKIVVIGSVHIKDARGEGWCDKLIYYPAQEKVVLIGNAKLKQGNNILIGDEIIAYRSGEVEVIGKGERVKTVIFPEGKVGATKRP
ncbi:lipopolysaccharide transport periplasmic protein LptA [Thermovibrio sp.]